MLTTPEERRASRRVRVRKHLGDDRYSWVLFIDGRPTYTGQSRDQIMHDRTRAIRNLAAGRQWNENA